MRIRKQAKLAGVPISNCISSGNQIKLRCQLNQSPWDVLTFPSDSSFPQIGGDYGFTQGGSSGNSLWPVKSVDPMEIQDPIGGDIGFFSDNGDGEEGDGAVLCGMTDGKTWKCMHEVAEGHAVCVYHLDQEGQKGSVATGSVATDHVPPKKKKRATQKVAPPPKQVYYFYSEVGPWSTKKRGAKGKDRTKPIAMEVDGEKTYGFVNDYDSDGDVIGETGGIKRARKPIKARSLKSLM